MAFYSELLFTLANGNIEGNFFNVKKYGFPARSAAATLEADEKISVQVYEENKSSAVQITWINNSGNRHYGTGTVWNTEGYIITNYHVIHGARASDLRVTFADETRCDKVQVILCFRTLDIAVLRVDAPREKLKPIQIGDSTEWRVGQNTYVIGCPFLLQNSSSTGVISGDDREILSSVTGHPIRGVIQTDAAINPGNSGGPLLVSSGEVIGINTCIISPSSGTSTGVGFAIPVKAVKKVVDMVMSFANDTSPNLAIESPQNQSSIWYIDIPNSVNGVCAEVSEIVDMALKAMKDTRPSLGIESSSYLSVEDSGDVANSANGVIVQVSGSADMMVRSVMDTRPNSRIESPPYDQSVKWSGHITNSANRLFDDVKLKHHGCCRHDHIDSIGYILREAADKREAICICWKLILNGMVQMRNGDVMVNNDYCEECGKMKVDILPRDHMNKFRPLHALLPGGSYESKKENWGTYMGLLEEIRCSFLISKFNEWPKDTDGETIYPSYKRSWKYKRPTSEKITAPYPSIYQFENGEKIPSYQFTRYPSAVDDVIDQLERYGKVQRPILGNKFAPNRSFKGLDASLLPGLYCPSPTNGPVGKTGSWQTQLEELLRSWICCCPATSSRKAVSCTEAGAIKSSNPGSRNIKCC